jgi:GT2 family glycosyltransferase
MRNTGMRPATTVSAIVVTYNRIALLQRCVDALSKQTRAVDLIVIVDNASTDGTHAWLQDLGSTSGPRIFPISLTTNSGGAGGFSEGMRFALSEGASWFWLMDDDAMPHEDALEALLSTSPSPSDIYGSIAVSGRRTSWPVTLIQSGKSGQVVKDTQDVPALAQVESLPFLGFLVHRNRVMEIGFPDPGFFVAADDVEYCIRAKGVGASLYVVGGSRIDHPVADVYDIVFARHRIQFLRLPPWKRYYDTRNRLLIARQYYGIHLITMTLPATILRIAVALVIERQRWGQLLAGFAGLVDGLLGRRGRLHEWWRIP